MGRRRKPGGPTGVLLVDKPRGITSFQVVAAVRRLLGSSKAGHTGTLDPMATGLLPVCLGDATRIATFLTEGDKAYRAEVLLGVETDSLDADGAVVRRDPPEAWADLTEDAVRAAMSAFRGPILQRPPALSAIKVDGQRAYARARRGETVELAERPVTIHALELVELRLPHLVIDVRCSKGTYIRTLGADLAASLGLAAHLTALRRTAVGPLSVVDSTPLEVLQLDADAAAARLEDCATALAHLPALHLDDAQATHIRCGRRFAEAGAVGLHRALDERGRILAVVARDAEGEVTVVRGFPTAGA